MGTYTAIGPEGAWYGFTDQLEAETRARELVREDQDSFAAVLEMGAEGAPWRIVAWFDYENTTESGEGLPRLLWRSDPQTRLPSRPSLHQVDPGPGRSAYYAAALLRLAVDAGILKETTIQELAELSRQVTHSHELREALGKLAALASRFEREGEDW